MNDANHAHNGPQPFLYCPQTPAEIDNYKINFNTTLTAQVSCHPRFNLDDLCKVSQDQCTKQTGQFSCFWALPTTETCKGKIEEISEQKLEEIKVNNFRYMSFAFTRTKNDPEIQKQCCGENQICKTHFSQVRLDPQRGLGREEIIGRVQFATNVMEVSIAMIGSCQNAECLDGLIFHELGHVCHQAQLQTGEVYKGAGKESPEKVKAALAKYMGVEGAKCISDRLDTQLKNAKPEIRNNPSTLQSWMEEAYADTIFADQWNPGRIAYNCNGNEDADHAQPKSYMGCWMYMEKFKRKFCANHVPARAQGPGQGRSPEQRRPTNRGRGGWWWQSGGRQ